MTYRNLSYSTIIPKNLTATFTIGLIFASSLLPSNIPYENLDNKNIIKYFGNSIQDKFTAYTYTGTNNNQWRYGMMPKLQESNLQKLKESNLQKLKESNLQKLKEYGLLEYNWNYNGAEAFKESLLLKVEHIINNVIQQPKIFPTARDSIQLEYYDKINENKYLELEVLEEHVEIFCIDAQGNESEKMIKHDIDEINKVVETFYAKRSC